MNKSAKIYVAGHRGMVGSAIDRDPKAKGFTNIVTRTHAELDLTNQQAVKTFVFRVELHLPEVSTTADERGCPING